MRSTASCHTTLLPPTLYGPLMVPYHNLSHPAKLCCTVLSQLHSAAVWNTLHCTLLHSTTFYCTLLQFSAHSTAFFSPLLRPTATCCNILLSLTPYSIRRHLYGALLQFTPPYRTLMNSTVPNCSVAIQCTLHSTFLHSNAPYCNLLQPTAPYCTL